VLNFIAVVQLLQDIQDWVSLIFLAHSVVHKPAMQLKPEP